MVDLCIYGHIILIMVHVHVTDMIYLHARIQLAALHFNENADREQAITKTRKQRYSIVFPKYKKVAII